MINKIKTKIEIITNLQGGEGFLVTFTIGAQ